MNANTNANAFVQTFEQVITNNAKEVSFGNNYVVLGLGLCLDLLESTFDDIKVISGDERDLYYYEAINRFNEVITEESSYFMKVGKFASISKDEPLHMITTKDLTLVELVSLGFVNGRELLVTKPSLDTSIHYSASNNSRFMRTTSQREKDPAQILGESLKFHSLRLIWLSKSSIGEIKKALELKAEAERLEREKEALAKYDSLFNLFSFEVILELDKEVASKVFKRELDYFELESLAKELGLI